MTSEASDTRDEQKPRDDAAARTHDSAIQPRGDAAHTHGDTAARLALTDDDSASRSAHTVDDDSAARPTLAAERSAAQPNRAAVEPAPVSGDASSDVLGVVSGAVSGDESSDEAASRTTAQEGDAAGVLRLQPRLMPRADGLYYVHEILAYHDEAFVEAAYAAVLRRQPAEDEWRKTLADLRWGAREKIDILRDLARSDEGKAQLAFERIAGLKQSRLAQFARSLPVVGHLWQILAALVRLPTALRHQRQFEAYALAQQQIIADHINHWGAAGAEPGQAGPAFRHSVADLSAAVSLLSDAMAEMAARHAAERAHLARRLDEQGRWIDEAGLRLAEHARRLDAQQEFLIGEQRAIVEAQKSALADAGEVTREALDEQRRELTALAARVDELRAAVDAARAIGGGKP